MFKLSPIAILPRSPQRGFPLVELLMVVAIIGTLAAVPIPSLASSRQQADSSSEVSSLRLIHSSETSYRTPGGSFGDLAMPGGAGYIAARRLRSGANSDHRFTATPGPDPAANYQAKALPAIDSILRRHHAVDATGVVHVQLGAEATSAGPPAK